MIDTLRTFDAGKGKTGSVSFLASPGREGTREDLPTARQHPHRAGIGAPQLRRQEGDREGRRNSGQLERQGARPEEIPFVVARIVLQDFTGVPLLVDLAAMRSAVARLGKDPKIIEPLVPVDLVVDHSVQVDFFGSAQALAAESRAGIQAQSRALPVPEVGPAGVQDVRRRAAGHRHRAPGESRISRQGRAERETPRAPSTIPTRSSAPTRTRR